MQLAIVAAGFTPGEADRLRRAMAAWKRRGGLGHFEQRLIEGMRERGYAESSRARSSSRSAASANTAFPSRMRRASRCWSTSRPGSSATSRRPSPARCSTASRWASTRRRSWCATRAAHGVEVRAVDVLRSDVDSARWRGGRGQACRRRGPAQPALRLGLRLVRALSAAGAAADRRGARAAGRPAPEQPCRDLRAGSRAPRCARARRPGGAGRGRRARRARGQPPPGVLGRRRPPSRRCRSRPRGDRSRRTPLLRAPTEGQDIVADYRALGLTLGRHPLALLRDAAARPRGILPAAELRDRAGGPAVRVAGIVDHAPAPGQRQRRHLRDAGGRDRARQPGGLAERWASAAARAARVAADGSARASCSARAL